MVSRYVLLLIGLLCSYTAISQIDDLDYYLVSTDFLPQKYQSEIERAEKLVQKGNKLVEKSNEAREKLQKYQDSDLVKPIELMVLKERLYRYQLKASTFFHDAHRREFKTLRRYLKEQYPLQYERIRDEAVKQFNRGSVLRKRGAEAIPANSPVSFIQEAVDYEKQALKDLEMIYVFDKKLITAKPPPVFETDSVFPGNNMLKELPEKYAVLKPEPKETVEKSIVSKEKPRVFFSIQFLAAKEAVSEQDARKVYNGSLPLIRSYGNGWHRFSAGRFESVEAATQIMKQEGIHGFVIAFKGDERISIKKAQHLLNP